MTAVTPTLDGSFPFQPSTLVRRVRSKRLDLEDPMNRIVLVVAAWALTHTALADRLAAQDLSVGIRAGGGLTTFRGDDARGLDDLDPGFLLAATIDYRFSELLGVASEVAWVQKGAKGTVQGFEEALLVHHEIDYLQIPALLRIAPFGFSASGPLVLYLVVGPALAFELDCDVKTDPVELALHLGCEDSAPVDSRRTIDWSLIAGGGVTYHSGRYAVSLDSRYDRGLVSLDRPPEALDIRNEGFTFSAGVSVRP